MREKDLAVLQTHFSEVVYDPWTTTGRRWYEEELLEELKKQQPDAFITELDEVQASVLDGYDKLQWVGDCRATPENIDVAAMTQKGIPLFCTPGRNAQAVAEMWLALVLNFYRNVQPSIKWMEEGGWVKGTTPYFLWMGNELMGKHIGFIGMGAVPRHILRLLAPFQCEISYYDPFVTLPDVGARKVESIDELMGLDIVSVHLPLNDQTEGVIDRRRLEMMKPTGVFVNTARAAVVDNDALFEILTEEKIRGAVLDVFEVEPPQEEDTRFFALTNCLSTPHICGSTYEIADHQSEIMTAAITRYLAGERSPQIIYNYRALEENAQGEA